MKEKRISALSSMIQRLDDRLILMIVNEYSDTSYYINDEYGIDDMCSGMSYDEILRAVSYGNYTYLDKFVWVNDHGNIESSDDLDVSFHDLAEWMIDNADDRAEDAWMIFNESSYVEDGQFTDDLADEFYCAFPNTEWDEVLPWFEDNHGDHESVKDYFTMSWLDLYEEFAIYLQEKNNEVN